MERKVVFVDGARSPFGRMGGTMRDIPASDVAGIVIKNLVEKTGIMERGKVDHVFAGMALHDIQTNNPARVAALNAGLPYEVSCSFVEMQCGSAIDAINLAAAKILVGNADVIIAGGMESHSQSFAKFSMALTPYRKVAPYAVHQKLAPVAEDDIEMLEVSENMAKKWGITREECDAFALESQKRAAYAMEHGYFKDEIAPIPIEDKRKKTVTYFDTDEHVRPETTAEGLAKLKPVLGQGCVTTAGNASGLNDGAAFVLMMTEEKAKELGYTPYARWLAGADYGVDPKLMGIGPAYSNLLALERAGIAPEDVDVWECNEAFAAQNLSVIKEMERITGMTIDRTRWNPNGGAIAFGHPNGASGARICIFTMKELERRNARYGVFSSCCGGGEGVSTVIENLRIK